MIGSGITQRHKDEALKRNPIEQRLKEEGFLSPERTAFGKRIKFRPDMVYDPPRFKYRLGTIQVLTDNKEFPFWTVQKMAGSRVEWFVDFPPEVGMDNMFTFIAIV